MKIVDYRLLTGNIHNIEDIVQNYITSGWQPIGGIAVSGYNSSHHVFAQAVVKYEERILS